MIPILAGLVMLAIPALVGSTWGLVENFVFWIGWTIYMIVSILDYDRR